MNHSEGQGYSHLYQSVSQRLSDSKVARYTEEAIRDLNYGDVSQTNGLRECAECHRSEQYVNKDRKCPFCAALGEISRDITHKDEFAIVFDSVHDSEYGSLWLDMPFGYRLAFPAEGRDWRCDNQVVRVYEKNGRKSHDGRSVRIWIADYGADMRGFEIASYESRGTTLQPRKGVARLGALRADVDNLGSTFVCGIPAERLSFSRSSALSRSLSYFFKVVVNEVLKSGSYQAQIIYSGGDDLFLIGNWSDVMYAAIDIRNALSGYIGSDAITISAGIGIFDAKYPFARIATEVGELEDAAKLFSMTGPNHAATKNAVSLWRSDNVFSWEEFIKKVTSRKNDLERTLFNGEKGSAFAYKLIKLLREFDEVASAPRLAYMLARGFENVSDREEDIARMIYKWALDANERRCLVAALEWYVYGTRERR